MNRATFPFCIALLLTGLPVRADDLESRLQNLPEATTPPPSFSAPSSPPQRLFQKYPTESKFLALSIIKTKPEAIRIVLISIWIGSIAPRL